MRKQVYQFAGFYRFTKPFFLGVIRMRNSIEKRREKLIDKLIRYNLFSKDDKNLISLTLSELEYEYRKFKVQNHPHGEFGSIRWT